jgi:hypothetical protein
MPRRDQQQHIEGARLMGLALALHRNPGFAAGITPSSELPQGMAFLLHVANGDEEPMTLAMRETGASGDELKQAAIGFFEQISFGPGDDPYRVLGVNPWAPPEEIREHYRLLIRLFHPDRGIARHRASDEYAARINQSYDAIRKQSSTPAAGKAASTMEQPFSARLRPAPPPASMLSLDSSPFRVTPQRVWGAIAAVAILFVGSVYLANHRPAPDPVPAAQTAASKATAASPSATKASPTAEDSKLDRLLEDLGRPARSASAATPPGATSSGPASHPDALKRTSVPLATADGAATVQPEKE